MSDFSVFEYIVLTLSHLKFKMFDILHPLDYFQNSIRGVADSSAPGLCIHDSDPNHLSCHHHSLTTDQHQEDAGKWAEGKNSC